MKEKIEDIKKSIKSYVVSRPEDIEAFRIKYLSKKGEVSSLFQDFKDIPSELKRQLGQDLNELKQFASETYEDLKNAFQNSIKKESQIDLSLPGMPVDIGTRHPVSLVKSKMIEIFKRIGYTVSEGAEIEDDEHNFGRLNFPENHPARDMQDTFFVSPDLNVLLRTHTSSVQAHEMQELEPPIRTISPGRVFRNESISARSHCQFHQIEGLYIDENVSFADLRQTLLFFSREMFGQNTKIRLRPSYFPFTEPSAEMDISCTICGGKGCKVCKNTGWVEILGCGMVDPNVFDAAGIDKKKYTGFAFGLGIERTAMLVYGINDIRLLFENDIRFLKQFTSAI
jgi:phenylalanyl-tRNA synthetase alpha chain